MKVLTTVVMWGGVLLLLGGCSETTREQQDTTVLPLQTGCADIGETKLYYEEMGQGHPLLMLHGGFLDRRMWDPQFEVFAKDYRVIRYDTRNHGNSQGVPGTSTHFDDLLKLMEALQIEKATVMGLSLGGRIAIDFAHNVKQPISCRYELLYSQGGLGSRLPSAV